MFAKYGGKHLNDPTSYGNDVYMSTGNFSEETGAINVGDGRPDRDDDGVPDEYGMEMYQGNLSNVSYQSINLECFAVERVLKSNARPEPYVL